MEVFIRQAHPGPNFPPYRDQTHKADDAARYQAEHNLPWTVLVDDLAGTVHRRYGGVADPTYLLDLNGRVAFYNMWTSAAVLHEALVTLMEQGGHGVVGAGWNRQPHLLPALTNGWPALERGLPQSYDEMERAVPMSGVMLRTGYALRPMLAPLTLRAEPLPLALRLGLLAGLLLAGVYLTRRVTR